MAAMIAPDTPPARRGPAPSATYEPSPASTPATAMFVPHRGETAKSASLLFFQAEDGIRGGHVTGVQTCALPISRPGQGRYRRNPGQRGGRGAPGEYHD